MKVFEDLTVRSEILLAMNRTNTEDRSKEIHLSDLDLCLKKAYYSKTDALPLSEDSIVKFFIGWAIQHELAGSKGETKLELNGVKMSLDLLVNGSFIEIKSTAASPGGNTTKAGKVNPPFSPTNMVHWMTRAMGYLKKLDQVYCYFGVVFLIQRQFKVYKIEFDKEEIEENWKDILRKKTSLLTALYDGEPPEQDYHAEWECSWCVNNVPGRCFGKVKIPE